MPTYENLAAFQRRWEKLDGEQRAAFRRALAVFVACLKAGESFSPELRVHKLVNAEIWSLTLGEGRPRTVPLRQRDRFRRDAHHLGSDRHPRHDIQLQEMTCRRAASW